MCAVAYYQINTKRCVIGCYSAVTNLTEAVVPGTHATDAADVKKSVSSVSYMVNSCVLVSNRYLYFSLQPNYWAYYEATPRPTTPIIRFMPLNNILLFDYSFTKELVRP